MKEELYHIALDDYEHGVVIRSLNDKKTDLKKEGKSTDAVFIIVQSDMVEFFFNRNYLRLSLLFL